MSYFSLQTHGLFWFLTDKINFSESQARHWVYSFINLRHHSLNLVLIYRWFVEIWLCLWWGFKNNVFFVQLLELPSIQTISRMPLNAVPLPTPSSSSVASVSEVSSSALPRSLDTFPSLSVPNGLHIPTPNAAAAISFANLVMSQALRPVSRLSQTAVASQLANSRLKMPGSRSSGPRGVGPARRRMSDKCSLPISAGLEMQFYRWN